MSLQIVCSSDVVSRQKMQFGLGLEVYGLGLKLCGLGQKVYGLGLEVYDLSGLAVLHSCSWLLICHW